MWGRWTIIPWGFLAAFVGIVRAVLDEKVDPSVLIVAALLLAVLAWLYYWMLQRR